MWWYFDGFPAIQRLKEMRKLIWLQKKRLIEEEEKQTAGAHLLILKMELKRTRSA